MRHFLKLFLVFSILSSSVFASPSDEKLGVYVGAEKHLNHSKFKAKHNDDFLNNIYRDGNIYAGVNISENVAVEGGYESKVVMTGRYRLTPEHCPRLIHMFMADRSYVSPEYVFHMKTKGPHISVLLSHKLGASPFSVLSSVGVSVVHGSIECAGAKYGPGGSNIIQGSFFKMSRSREVFRFMVGGQYLRESGLGLRGSVSCISGKKMSFKNASDPQHPHSYIHIPRIKMKDSAAYGLGVFWAF